MNKIKYDNLRRFVCCAILITILVLVVLIYKKVNKGSSSSSPSSAMAVRASNTPSLPDLRIKITSYDGENALGVDSSGNKYTMTTAGLQTRIGSYIVVSTQGGQYNILPNIPVPNVLNFAVTQYFPEIFNTIQGTSSLYNQYINATKNSPTIAGTVSVEY